jgi:hypothetical protein
VKRALASLLLLVATTAVAHSISRADAIAQLSSAEVRTSEGIQRAWSPSEKTALLIVEVSKEWREKPAEARRRTARRWLDLWRHAAHNGRLSVVDASGEPVLRFTPTGDVQLGE